MYGILTATILLLSGAARLSLLGEGVVDHSDDAPTGSPAAAIGESEVYRMRLENGGEPRHIQALTVTWPEGVTIHHQAYRPAHEGDFFPGTTPVADALVPLEEFELAEGASLDLLLLLRVPPLTDPGHYRGTVHVTFDDGSVADCPLAFRVYDLVLPPTPALPAFFDLDLDALAGRVNIPFDDLDSWTAYYDSLNELGIAYRVWFQPQADGLTLDTTTLRDHLRYVASTTAMPVVDVGGAPGYFVSREELPSPYAPQDNVQLHLHDMLASVASVASGVPTVAQPALFGARARWHRIRQDLARFSRADSQIRRILAAPPHPHFERYTDIWALPETTSPEVVQWLATGQSLIRYDQDAAAISVGSAGMLDATGTYQTLASEAVDGSETTAWQPAAVSGGEPAWLEITFQDLYPLESLTLLGDCAPDESGLVVETAYQPGAFTRASLSWERVPRRSETGLPVHVGTFRYPRDCRAVRLRFSPSAGHESIAIAEILFNNAELRTAGATIPRIVPWLDYSAADHAVWRMGGEGYGGGPRALGWRAWTLGFQGLLGPTLNAATGTGIPLVGTGQHQFLPTRRLFALRDGLEDYAYLRLYWERVRGGALTPQNDFFPGTLAETMVPGIQGDLARRGAREKMGRILSGDSIVTKNFGP